MAIRHYGSLGGLSKVPKTWNCVPMSQLWIPGLVKSVDRNVTENSKALQTQILISPYPLRWHSVMR